jgi:hypothetical protein
MIPPSTRFPVPNDYVLRYGALFLSVDKAIDWDRVRDEDNQKRNEHGIREWVITGMDQDPDAARFGRSPQIKVTVASEYQPVPPDGIELPGGVVVRPVEFIGLTATPYVDTNACKGTNKPHKCRARLAWSLRAEAMVTPGTTSNTTQAAA